MPSGEAVWPKTPKVAPLVAGAEPTRAAAPSLVEVFSTYRPFRFVPPPLQNCPNIETTPLKVLVPEKVCLPLSNGTLAESRASARVPNARLAALSVVRPMPLPTKAPLNLLFTLVSEATPLKTFDPEKI